MKPHKNSRHEVEITAVTAKGFGIAHLGDFIVFVDGAITGDKILAHIVKVKPRYAYGKIVEILSPSPHRVQSPCAVSAQCGGCQFMHCDYPAQLEIKKDTVKSAIEKIGGISNPPVFDVKKHPSDPPFRYRNKAVFPIAPTVQNEVVSDTNHFDSFAIGMYAPRSHRLVEVSDCIIQHEAHVSVLAALKAHMRRHKISAYNETAHQGCVRHIVVRTSLHTGEVMAVLVVREHFPAAHEFAAALGEAGVSTVLLNRNTSRTNTIFGDVFETLTGSGFICEKIGEIEYKISAPSFFQINPAQTKILYETAIEMAGLSGEAPHRTVIDAHCGTGGIALFAAKHAARVIGVDIAPSSILDARENAERNGISNAEFICGAAEEILPDMITGSEIVFLDPPRKGCDPVLLDALIAAQVPRIVYISCDPATLARDIKCLTQGGFTLTAVSPVDMFPFTGKVECVAVLERA